MIFAFCEQKVDILNFLRTLPIYFFLWQRNFIERCELAGMYLGLGSVLWQDVTEFLMYKTGSYSIHNLWAKSIFDSFSTIFYYCNFI
jgi:hypothetical protein